MTHNPPPPPARAAYFNDHNDQVCAPWNRQRAASAALRRYENALVSLEQARAVIRDQAARRKGLERKLAQLERDLEALLEVNTGLRTDLNVCMESYRRAVAAASQLFGPAAPFGHLLTVGDSMVVDGPRKLTQAMAADQVVVALHVKQAGGT